MIDHLTYQVPTELVHSEELEQFMELTGLFETPVNLKIDPVDADYVVRWWRDEKGMGIRIVGVDAPPLDVGLGHWCVKLGKERFAACLASGWVERYNPASPLGRCWLKGPGGLRVEVQPHG